jgi:hypothetical protein
MEPLTAGLLGLLVGVVVGFVLGLAVGGLDLGDVFELVALVD